MGGLALQTLLHLLYPCPCIDKAAALLQRLPSTQQLLTAHFLRFPSSPTFPLQIPHLAALAYHKCTGRKPAMPNQRLSYAENFLYMLDGGANPNYKPNPRLARALVGGGCLWAFSVGWTARALHCDKTLRIRSPVWAPRDCPSSGAACLPACQLTLAKNRSTYHY